MVAENAAGASKTPAVSLQSKLQTLPLFVRDFIAGGVAGAIAKSSVAPLERTKILFQTRGGEVTSVAGTLRLLWEREGVHGLFKGNGASVLRIVPYAASHFAAYEYYKRVIYARLGAATPAPSAGGSSGVAVRPSPVWDLLAGSLSGATAVVLTYPLDLVRTRLAWATEVTDWRHQARGVGIMGTLRRTVSEEGVRGLYRGMLPSLVGVMPYAGIKFYTYVQLKHCYWAWMHATTARRDAEAPAAAGSGGAAMFATDQPLTEGGVVASEGSSAVVGGTTVAAATQAPQAAVGPEQRLPLPMALVFGGISGLMGQTLTYPLDVVRRQMQVEGVRQLHGNESAPINSSLPSSSRVPLATAGSSSNGSSGGGGSGSSAASTSGRTPATSAAVHCGGNVHSSALRPPPAPRLERHGMLATLRSLVAQHGVRRGLFRGLSLNYMKVVPSTAIGWSVYEAAKAYLGCASNL